MDRFEDKEERILINNVSLNYCKKRVSVPTQQYCNGANMKEIFHDITTKMRQRKTSMTWTNKEEVKGSFNLTKPGNNTMHTFFIIIYLSSVEIWKVCWMRETTDQHSYRIMTSLNL